MAVGAPTVYPCAAIDTVISVQWESYVWVLESFRLRFTCFTNFTDLARLLIFSKS